MQSGRIFLLMPAYNPGSGIVRIVKEALPHVTRVVIVDDGCNETEKIYLRKCSEDDHVTLLVHDANRGKGVALHTGINHCLARMDDERDFILTMDSDGQHDPDDILRFKDLLTSKEENVHFALGERLDDSRMPIKSRIGNSFMRFLFRMQFGGQIHDTQTGFRLLSAKFARHFADVIIPGRYETEMDMLILASRVCKHIHTVQINTIYFDNNKGSKFKPIMDSWIIVKLFAMYSAVSIASFGFDYLAFIILTYLLEIPYLLSNVLARFFSAVFNFLGHKGFSFKSKKHLGPQAVKYALAVAATLMLATTLLYLCVAGLDIPEYIAKPLVDGVAFCINFFVLGRFVFRERPHV